MKSSPLHLLRQPQRILRRSLPRTRSSSSLRPPRYRLLPSFLVTRRADRVLRRRGPRAIGARPVLDRIAVIRDGAAGAAGGVRETVRCKRSG